MKQITQILMERDGMCKADADELYDVTYDEIMDAISCGDFDLAEDIMMYDLGLEPDYFDMMF